jgi:hypothetical protein
MNTTEDKSWSISYNTQGLGVTCYGSKSAVENLADHLENQNIKFEIKKTEELPNESSGS